MSMSNQGSSSIKHGLVREEVLLRGVIAVVGQLIVLNQKAQVSHLPNLQLRGFWGVSEVTEAKRSDVHFLNTSEGIISAHSQQSRSIF